MNKKITALVSASELNKFKKVCKFIEEFDAHILGLIINEILTVHSNLIAWDEDTKALKDVKSISMNGGSIQLNLEQWKHENNKE